MLMIFMAVLSLATFLDYPRAFYFPCYYCRIVITTFLVQQTT